MEIINQYRKCFKGQESISRITDSDSGNFVDLISMVGDLEGEHTTFASLGMSSFLNSELIVVAQKNDHKLEDIFLQLCLLLMHEPVKCFEGFVLEDTLSVIEESEMNHILFTSPFLWKDQNELEKSLLLVPISDTELAFLNEFGPDKLQELLAIYDVDVSDYNRKSVAIPQI